MIKNARNIPLSQQTGTLPSMRDAMANWFQPLKFTQVIKSIVNYKNVETLKVKCFNGVIQPMKAQELMMRPDGQRAWIWKTVHAYPDLVLVPDDIIIIQGVKYRVMDKTDYTEYGYVVYNIVQNYTGDETT